MNVHRLDNNLDRKQHEEVAPNALALARVQNVAVLRAWDLYQLVGLKLDGQNVGEDLPDALPMRQGGWFRVNDAGISFIQNR